MIPAMAKGPTLADVLAAPDDLDLRMVWADALQAAGDPRGELAALQLAKTKTYEGWVREAELIQKHGREWASPLDDYFSTYVFEGGLFAGGLPAYGFAPDPDNLEGVPGASFTEPAWKAITTIVELYYGQHALDSTQVKVRRLRQVWETELIELLASKRPLDRIVELGVQPQGDGSPAIKALGTCKTFPNLRTLTIHGPRPHIAKVLDGSSVLARIERLGIEEVGEYTRADALIAAAVASKGALREVVIRFSERRQDLGWLVTLRRDKPGPFTEVVAWWRYTERSQSPKQVAAGCIRILNLVDRSKVRSLSIETGRPMRFPSDLVRTLTEQVAEMPLQHCVVPWQVTPLKAPAAGEQTWHLAISELDTPKQLPAVWKALGPQLGVAWDALSVNGRGAPSLGRDPVAALKKRFPKRYSQNLAILRTGSTDAIHMTNYQTLGGSFTTSRSPSELATWFATMVAALAPAGLVSCGRAAGVAEHHAFDLETYGAIDSGWLIALPPALSKGVTPKHLAKLGALPVACKGRVVFTIGADPAKLDDRRARAFAANLVELLDELRASKVPPWFAAVVRREIAPYVKRFKLSKTCDRPLRMEWSRGKKFIRVRLDNTKGRWKMAIASSGGLMGIADTEIPDAESVEAELADLAPYLRRT